MKTLWLLVCVLPLMGCWGNASLDNEVIAQPKKIHNRTPMMCGNFQDVDVSLGVLRNGVGSMSTQDIDLAITSSDQAATLQHAVEDGKLVKIIYDEQRFNFCRPEMQIRSVTVVEGTPQTEGDKKAAQIQKLQEELKALGQP